MVIMVYPRWKDSEYGVMKWYGRKGQHDLFQAPTGRIYEVIDPGSQKAAQKVAFAAWKKDGFK